MSEPSEKALALIVAHARGPDAFAATYAALRPSPDDVGELIRLAGRAGGLGDQELVEIMERYLEKKGL